MSSGFVTGDRGFGFKMAFDEAFRSYAPGQLLMRHVADHVAGLHPPIHFDTCTAAGAGGCRSLWGDSRTIVDCVVASGSPARRLAFAGRADERCVGKEGVRTWRSRWAADH